jgi:hypothetical protein
LRERRDERVGHAIGEVVLIWFLREVIERQNRERSDTSPVRRTADGSRRHSTWRLDFLRHLERFERSVHLAGILVSLGRILGEAAQDHLPQCGLHALRHQRRGVCKDRRAQGKRRGTLVRTLTSGQFVQHDAKRPHVSARRRGSAAQLLRGHVWQCSRERTVVELRCRRSVRHVRLGLLRQSEIQDLDSAGGGDDQIGWFDIAVDDVSCVCVSQRVSDLETVAEHRFERQSFGRDEIAERLSLDEFHHDERVSAFVLDLIDRADARMIERRRCTCFPQQAPAAGVIRDAMEELDRDVASKLLVVGAKHRAHSAGPDSGDDTVTSDLLRSLRTHDVEHRPGNSTALYLRSAREHHAVSRHRCDQFAGFGC